jgi:hypothetical protein
LGASGAEMELEAGWFLGKTLEDWLFRLDIGDIGW